MVVPGSSLFLVLIHYIKAGHTTLSALFFISYLIVATMQARLNIYTGHILFCYILGSYPAHIHRLDGSFHILETVIRSR